MASPQDVIVEDLSITGFQYTSKEPAAAGDLIRIGLAGSGQADAKVIWREGARHGASFTTALAQSSVDAAFTNDQAGVTATIVREPNVARAIAYPAHPTREAPLDQRTWRTAPFTSCILAMLAGGLIWKILVALLHIFLAHFSLR